MLAVSLGVNIDHVATLRNARGTIYPDPFDAISLAQAGGADGITIHLREDRRHINDNDVKRICSAKPLPINLEMAATQEMLQIALENKPHEVCLVPEKRQELTTEGGLDVAAQQDYLCGYVKQLKEGNILVSLFIDPDVSQIQASAACAADIIELHTGRYAELEYGSDEWKSELDRLTKAAQLAHELGMTVNAGHGLTVENAYEIAKLPEMNCLNIGHSIIAKSVFIGLENAVAEMKDALIKS